jgi:hypothetical protein
MVREYDIYITVLVDSEHLSMGNCFCVVYLEVRVVRVLRVKGTDISVRKWQAAWLKHRECYSGGLEGGGTENEVIQTKRQRENKPRPIIMMLSTRPPGIIKRKMSEGGRVLCYVS